MGRQQMQTRTNVMVVQARQASASAPRAIRQAGAGLWRRKVADPRAPSVRSRILQIPGPARAPVPARRVLALGGRPVEAPINKVLHIPEGIAQRVILQILVGGGTAVT